MAEALNPQFVHTAPLAELPVRLDIRGMVGPVCAAVVEQALAAVPGVATAKVSFASAQAVVTLAMNPDELVTDDALLQAVKDAGYEARVNRPEEVEAGPAVVESRSYESWWVAAGVLLCLPLVLPMSGELIGQHWMLPPLWQWLLASPVQWLLGARFYRSAWEALKAKTGNMELLVVLGTTTAYGLSVYNAWPHIWHHLPGRPDLYFESAAVVITLVRVGKWLEARAQRRTVVALEALRSLRPATAWLWRDGVKAQVPVGDLRLADEVLVHPGERVPADGVVLEGTSLLDESLLTGEAKLVACLPGRRVVAGAINGDGLLRVRVVAVGAQTQLERIVRLVTSAQASKAPTQELVDKVSAVFVPAAVLVALFTFAVWAVLLDDMSVAVLHAVSVLVIACPCALGLATPVTLMVATALAGQRGVLVRSPQALEQLGDVSTIAFDKTGTLTEGRPRLLYLSTLEGVEQADALAMAAALEAGSEHSLASAVLDAAKAAQFGPMQPHPAAVLVRAVPGRGIEGEIGNDHLYLGNETWLPLLGAGARATLKSQADFWARQGCTVSWLVRRKLNGPAVAIAAFAFGDKTRPGAGGAIKALQRQGVRCVLISGDNLGAAQTVAEQMGLDEVHARVLPADKATLMQSLHNGLPEGSLVGMVGDGVNDAPALAAADVGIAMGSGTDVAMETAGITLLHPDLGLVPWVRALSLATTRKLRQNLFLAFAYNAIGVPFAVLGWANPLLAGGAMALSSICVVANSLALRRWQADR